GAVALTALATGAIAADAGLRPAPFMLGLAYAGMGLAASALLVRETSSFVRHERAGSGSPSATRWRTVFLTTSFRDRSLSSACQAGLVNNLNDGIAWGLLPLHYAADGLSVREIGVLAAVYPGIWALTQVLTG